MSITSSGPIGDKFQEEVGVWFFLLHADEPGFRLIMEPAQGEDLEAIFTTGTVEIQVKHERTDFDFRWLTDMLFHFPPGSSSQPLLERLRNDERRRALFVVGGRCTDQTRRLVTDGTEPLALRNGGIAREDVSNFQAAIVDDSRMKSGTELHDQRRAARRVTTINASEVFRVGKQISVKEEMTRESVQEASYALLIKRRVPSSRAVAVFEEMALHVFSLRALHGDVAPGLTRILQNHMAGLIFSVEDQRLHVARPEEASLLEVLKSRCVLLLTGQAQCGKTQMGRRLVQWMQDEGFVWEWGGLEKAREFLLAGNPEDRIFLLEGELEGAAASIGNAWHRIDQLIRVLPQHRMLVITARIDALRSMLGADGRPAAIDSHEWVDLTLRDPETASKIWHTYAGDKGLPLEKQERYDAQLRAQLPSHLVQPGQSRRLALEYPAGDEAPGTLDSFARFNAQTLAAEIRERQWTDLRTLVALGLCGTPLLGVRPVDLAFVLSSEEGHLPGLLDSRYTPVRILGAGTESEVTFPTYNPEPKISERSEQSLDEFERKGWLDWRDGMIVFRHPDYWEAAQQLATNLTQLPSQDLLKMVRRALGCLGSNSAMCAAKSLGRLDKPEFRKLALLALESIFPSVRDAALSYLVRRVEQLDEADAKEVGRRTVSVGYSGHGVRWSNGKPWLSMKPKSFDTHELVGSDDPVPPATKIETPQDAWNALCNHREQGLDVIARCLQFEEVFIRVRAAELLLKLHADEAGVLWSNLLDDHASVIVAAFRGAVESWPSYAPTMKAGALEKFLKAFARPDASSAMARIMWKYDDHVGEESEAISERWRFWASLLPTFLDALPTRGWMVDGDNLPALTSEAKKHLSPESQVKVGFAWLRWIERTLSDRLPDGDSLAVAAYLLEVLTPGSAERLAALPRLLRHADTGFTAVSLRSYLQSWSTLSPSERSAVHDLLGEERVDRLWLQAVALTTRDVPDQIVGIVCGKPDALRLPPEDLIKLLPTDLLNRCLHVHVGEPQPLWRLGLQSNAPEAWEPVTQCILPDMTHPVFALSWHHALGSAPGTEPFASTWATLSRQSSPTERDRLLALLIDACDWFKGDFAPYWLALWSSCQDPVQRYHWATRLAEDIEELENRIGSLDKIPKDILKEVFEELPADRSAFFLLSRLHNDPSNDTISDDLQHLTKSYSIPNTTPRTEYVHDWVLSMAEKYEGTQQLRDSVEAARTVTSERGMARLYGPEQPIASSDWVYAYKRRPS